MDFEVHIGLEFHIQLKTHQKLFSNAINAYEKEANKNVSMFDVAFPGTLPILNIEVVKMAIKACHALHMGINNVLRFDRKHYFYSDLPKGYQITQEDEPIGRNGYITLKDGTSFSIYRLHIEEDTCKQVHKGNFTYLDFNRCDAPLIEVVTLPLIKTGKQAKEVAKAVKKLVTDLSISDGKMEQGSLRVDVNVSLCKKGDEKFGTKVEIKNLNTFENIEKAVNYEISRQKSLLLENKRIKQETFRFDEKLQSNVLMRIKEDFVDYRIFTDPNIPPYKLTKEFIDSVIAEIDDKDLACLKDLKPSNAEILSSNKDLRSFYFECLNFSNEKELISNFICNEFKGFIKNYRFKKVNEIISAEDFVKLLTLFQRNILSKKDVLKNIEDIRNGKSSMDIISKSQESHKNMDILDLKASIQSVIEENQEAVKDYKMGKNKALGYLIKKLIDKTGNNINIKLASSLIVELIKGE